MVKRKMQTPLEVGSYSKLGIIAGSGDLPVTVIRACQALDRKIFVVSIDDGGAKPAILSEVPHVRLNIGAVGKAIKSFKQEGVTHLVLAGSVKRPSFTSLRPDAAGIKLLAQISKSKISGDNSLLSIVIRFFESAGFLFSGVDEVVKELLVPESILGAVQPTEEDDNDIALGKRVAHAIGNLDIGQSVIVQQGFIIGVEAVEGTDALMARCAALQQPGRGGILVKMKKPDQDTRVDLPTIGVNTVVNAHKAGLVGIAIEAGAALIIDRKEVVKQADSLGLFIVGV